VTFRSRDRAITMLEKRSLKRRLHWMSQGFAQTMCQNGVVLTLKEYRLVFRSSSVLPA
jgi:hypothetical protein